jgi:hypothetical protein
MQHLPRTFMIFIRCQNKEFRVQLVKSTADYQSYKPYVLKVLHRDCNPNLKSNNTVQFNSRVCGYSQGRILVMPRLVACNSNSINNGLIIIIITIIIIVNSNNNNNKSGISNNRGNRNHLRIIQKIPEQHTGKTRNQGTTEQSHIGHCTRTTEFFRT